MPRSNCKSAKDAAFELLNDGKYCDVTFKVGPSMELMSCHSLILRSRSSVFDDMYSLFEEQSRAEQSKQIFQMKVKDVTAKVFKSFLEFSEVTFCRKSSGLTLDLRQNYSSLTNSLFMNVTYLFEYFIYTDEWTANLSNGEVINLLIVGLSYSVEFLVKRCEEILTTKINSGNTIFMYQNVARVYGLIELERVTLDYMARSFSRLLNSFSVNIFEERTLVRLLGRDDLGINELKLFEAMISWSQHLVKLEGKRDPASGPAQRKFLKRIVPLIRFPLLKFSDFTKKVVPAQILTSEETVALFMYFTDDGPSRARCLDQYGFSHKPRKLILIQPIV